PRRGGGPEHGGDPRRPDGRVARSGDRRRGPGAPAPHPGLVSSGQKRRDHRPCIGRAPVTQEPTHTPPPHRVVMVVPTYNEADNLEWIVGRLRSAEPDVDVLVVDDNSPDGTGALADRLAEGDPR